MSARKITKERKARNTRWGFGPPPADMGCAGEVSPCIRSNCARELASLRESHAELLERLKHKHGGGADVDFMEACSDCALIAKAEAILKEASRG